MSSVAITSDDANHNHGLSSSEGIADSTNAVEGGSSIPSTEVSDVLPDDGVSVMVSLPGTTTATTATTTTTTTTNGVTASSSSSSSAGLMIPKAHQFIIDENIRDTDDLYLPMLNSMAIGLTDEEKCVLHRDKLLKKFYLTKTAVKPSIEALKSEVWRRYTLLKEYYENNYVSGDVKKIKKPKYNNWTATKLKGWLEKHPLNDMDKEWVKSSLSNYYINHEQKLEAIDREMDSQGMTTTQKNENRMKFVSSTMAASPTKTTIIKLPSRELDGTKEMASLDKHGLDEKSIAERREVECLTLMNNARDYEFKVRETFLGLKKEYFNAKKEGEKEEIGFYEKQVEIQEGIYNSAKQSHVEATAKYNEAKTACLELKTKLDPSADQSLPAKKRRLINEEEENLIAGSITMRDESHDFTSMIVPPESGNIDAQESKVLCTEGV